MSPPSATSRRSRALKAPAELVAPLLAAALPPNGSELQVAWLSFERLEGRANVTVPEPALAKLTAVGSATVRGATGPCSRATS